MKKLISVAVASVVVGSAGASAQVSTAEWQQFKAQFDAMAERVSALEAENRQLRDLGEGITIEDLAATRADVDALKAQSKSSSWSEKLMWKGDFRYRYEDIEQDGKDDRTRNRIRARAQLIAKLPSNTEVGLGIATGGDDPVSTNQTLGGGGSTKDVRLDMAYFKWKATDEMYLQAGKYKNPWFKPNKSPLVFDGDFRPEGFSGGWQNKNFFALVTGNWLESDSRNEDEFAYGLQAGGKFGPFTGVVGYLDIPTAGIGPIYDDDFFGNTSVDGVYAFDHELLTLSAELSLDVGGLPLSFYGDYVKNNDADDLDSGYLVGTKLGKAKKKGSWQIQYQYQDLEADATLGLWTDSDFAGGGTDNKGHRVAGKYALTDKWSLGFTYIDSQTGVDLGKDDDYKRLMIDTAFKY